MPILQQHLTLQMPSHDPGPAIAPCTSCFANSCNVEITTGVVLVGKFSAARFPPGAILSGFAVFFLTFCGCLPSLPLVLVACSSAVCYLNALDTLACPSVCFFLSSAFPSFLPERRALLICLHFWSMCSVVFLAFVFFWGGDSCTVVIWWY